MPRKVVWQYYLLVVLLFGGVNATAAMDTNFLLSRGLDKSDVYLVRFAYFATLVLCEFPTGVLADKLGRKPLVLVSFLIFIPSMALYACSWGFWWFALAAAFSGLAQACASGACEAWLVGRIRHHTAHGGDARLGSRFSFAWALRHFAAAGSGCLGAYLADLWNILPWILAGCIFAFAFVYAWREMPEEYFVPQSLSPSELWSDMKLRANASFKYGMGNSRIQFLMWAVFGLYFAVMAPNLMWQPYFSQWVPDNSHNGLIWLGVSVSLMFGALIAPIVVNGFASERKTLVICSTIVALGIVSAAYLDFPYALAMFFIYQAARGAFGAIKDPFLHHSIEGEEQRAAVASLESIAYHAGGALGLLTWGFILRGTSIQVAWLSSGLLLLGFGAILALIFWLRKETSMKIKPRVVGVIVVVVLLAIGVTMTSDQPASLKEAMLLQAPPPPIGRCCF